jgi:hypothetical protein
LRGSRTLPPAETGANRQWRAVGCSTAWIVGYHRCGVGRHADIPKARAALKVAMRIMATQVTSPSLCAVPYRRPSCWALAWTANDSARRVSYRRSGRVR